MHSPLFCQTRCLWKVFNKLCRKDDVASFRFVALKSIYGLIRVDWLNLKILRILTSSIPSSRYNVNFQIVEHTFSCRLDLVQVFLSNCICWSEIWRKYILCNLYSLCSNRIIIIMWLIKMYWIIKINFENKFNIVGSGCFWLVKFFDFSWRQI